MSKSTPLDKPIPSLGTLGGKLPTTITSGEAVYRVTFVVDQETFYFLLKAHSMNESNETWIWESTEDLSTVTQP